MVGDFSPAELRATGGASSSIIGDRELIGLNYRNAYGDAH